MRGDFNCYESPLDKLGNVSVQKELTNFRVDFHFIDIWRKKHPRERSFTWFNFDRTIAGRLDKFLVSKSVSEKTSVCEIFPCVFSDHDFVSLNFNVSGIPARGPGVWKFNNSLLQDIGFRDAIRKSLDDHLRFNTLFRTLRKEISINFSRRKRADANRERVSLTNKLRSLKRRLDC